MNAARILGIYAGVQCLAAGLSVQAGLAWWIGPLAMHVVPALMVAAFIAHEVWSERGLTATYEPIAERRAQSFREWELEMARHRHPSNTSREQS